MVKADPRSRARDYTLDRDVITSLASAEPAWLRELRQAAFDRFELIPEPTERTLGWRRLDLKGLDLSPAPPEPATFKMTVASVDRARGVIAKPLNEAVLSHEALVQEAQLQARGGRALSKYAALAEAAWLGGVFIHVPDGVEVSEPIFIQADAGAYPHVVINIGKRSRASIA
ncbi:MAG TPA: hypothetical protein VIX35_13725, partial [Vicinamibacterales bacterium]